MSSWVLLFVAFFFLGGSGLTLKPMLSKQSHGDGHEFNLDRIDKYNANLFDLECDSGDIADPLLITITRSGSERDGLNVDRRGGRYPDGDCAPDNRDKTWSSDMF